ncbi:MAG TPA: BsuBI/PstI family type II restriction endonuclease [Chitinophagaceae bacterium]|nr:BsuBI/PstI family type II restriction endonuclease [Chitinophagaceae bacterium]
MTHEQAALSDDESRRNYLLTSKRGFQPAGERWYADNTRESIRDETLKDGLVNTGAVLELKGIPTTSGKARYFLKKDFAALFDPKLTDDLLKDAIAAWQLANLSKSALTRLTLAGLGGGSEGSVLITFPNKETRSLTAGPSSPISKAVIEQFALRFLEKPAVLWLSTSDDKVVARDDKMAAAIGLQIDASKHLPDIILVDLAPKDPLLVFVEVVATDGAITESRQNAIYKLTDVAGFDRKQVVFVTAYLDRGSIGFSKTIKGIAWNSFVWFVSEPDKLVFWKDEVKYISQLIG